MIPEGYMLVPIKPTQEMIKAGGECPQMRSITGVMSLHQARGYKIEGMGDTWDTSALAEAYRTMLDAAPSPSE